MKNVNHNIVSTLRVKDLNSPGMLGRLAVTIGDVGANVGNVTTVHLGNHYVVRDIEISVKSEEHLSRVLNEVSNLKEVNVLEVRDDILNVHKSGKIKTISTLPINSLDNLRKVYTPGVAEVCELIKAEPSWKDAYTSIPYSVAVVTDGTAILGLGNIGPVAGMPVMEGKAALLQQLADINGIPILLDTTDPDEIVETVKHIAPTFAGIHLEDIASPRCFTIQGRLEEELEIPVMHDDQQGTAVVVLASLINACKITNVKLREARIGIIGLGAAGLCIGKFILRLTGNPALGTARTEASIRRHVELGGIPSSLEEIMQKADIVIAVTGVAGLIEPRMVKKGQVIFALSNPFPEIMPEQALASGAALATDGKTVNNLVGYPGIWRGTLDAKASGINFEMYKAAVLAIADATAEEEIAPSPLDTKVHLAVAHSVAKAAVESGVAQRQLDDDYFENNEIEEPFTYNLHDSKVNSVVTYSAAGATP
jgi:malate dehydrogenase (oxaloacetate-decarboxylating)